MKAAWAARVLWGVAALALAAAFAGLGFWQLDRAEDKAQRLAAWQAAVDGPTAALEDVLADPVLPRRVAGTGEWIEDGTFLLDNQVREGRAGAMVYSLLRPHGDTGERLLLVNRGWIRLPPDRRVPLGLGPAGREARVSGLLVPPPSTGLVLGDGGFTPAAKPALVTHLDLDALATAYGASLHRAVLLLDADRDDGYTRDWAPLPNTLPPVRHRGYAVQWFGLAALVLATWLVLTLRPLFRR